jgi:hypothetical protein
MSYQYHGQPGYSPHYPPPPPRKNNTALIVALIVVIVAAVVAMVLVLVLRDGDDNSTSGNGSGAGSGSGSDSGSESGSDAGGASAGDSSASAKALGQKVAEVIQNHSMDEAERLVCKPDSKFLRSMRGLEGVDLKVTLNGVTESGETAEAAITMVTEKDNKSSNQKIHLKKSAGKWCIN